MDEAVHRGLERAEERVAVVAPRVQAAHLALEEVEARAAGPARLVVGRPAEAGRRQGRDPAPVGEAQPAAQAAREQRAGVELDEARRAGALAGVEEVLCELEQPGADQVELGVCGRGAQGSAGGSARPGRRPEPLAARARYGPSAATRPRAPRPAFLADLQGPQGSKPRAARRGRRGPS